MTWRRAPSIDVFASWATPAREPAFRDLYDAEGPGAVPLYRVVDVVERRLPRPADPPRARAATSSWARAGSAAHASASANLFRMDFRDELVYAGAVHDTDLGYPILGNAARSIHQGVELVGSRGGLASSGARASCSAPTCR